MPQAKPTYNYIILFILQLSRWLLLDGSNTHFTKPLVTKYDIRDADVAEVVKKDGR